MLKNEWSFDEFDDFSKFIRIKNRCLNCLINFFLFDLKLYILVPVGLVVFIISVFVIIVIFVGIKARSRSARFTKEPNTTIRNIHYITDANTFIENLKPLPSLTHSRSTIGYVSSERDYAENYGRV
jgi:hypothetical protein